MTDRLTLAHASENGGISRDAAEHIATEIFDAIHDNVATKVDLCETETRLQANIDAVRTDLRVEIERVRSELIPVGCRDRFCAGRDDYRGIEAVSRWTSLTPRLLGVPQRGGGEGEVCKNFRGVDFVNDENEPAAAPALIGGPAIRPVV